jgi:hypothetical protein
MAKSNIDREKLVKKRVQDMIATGSELWTGRQTVRLGDYTGVVQTAIPGVYNARQRNGVVIEVLNTLDVPPYVDLRVMVGKNKYAPDIWQIVRAMQDYDNPPNNGEITYHHKQHEETGGDRLYLDRKQIIQLSVRAYTGFTVILFGGIVNTSSGLAKVKTQAIDLSSYVITSGGKWVAIETNTAGNVHLPLNEGVIFASPRIGAVNQMPTPVAGRYTRAWVLLYEGQEAIQDKDIVMVSNYDVPYEIQVLALNDLSDVNAPNPEDGQVLTYDFYAEEWIAADPTGGAVDKALQIVMQPDLIDPPEPVLTVDGDDYVYYEVEI